MSLLLANTQQTTSGRMKRTFIILCVSLCVISFILYSRTTVNWKLLHTIFFDQFLIRQTESAYVNISSTIKQIELTTQKPDKVRLSPSENRRFAVFACSIHASALAYTFYTPLTAASWKRVGYDTIVVFVGDFTRPNVLTARLNLSRTYLKHVGAHIVDVQCNESYSIKLSQLVRVFSGFLPDNIVGDEDNILTGDSDLMPLKASEYKPSPGTDGYIFNAHCCGAFQRRGKSYRMFPMGHVFLQKKAWRAMVIESKQRAELLVNADSRAQSLLSENASLTFDMISLYGRHEFQGVFDQRMDKGDSAWYMDQVLCSMLITDYRVKHPNFSISERGRADRLDRAYGIDFWNRDNFDQFGDAHLIHDEILQERSWNIFNKLLKALFNETIVTLFNDYYKKYMIVEKTIAAKRKR